MPHNRELLKRLRIYTEEFDLVFLIWKKGKAVERWVDGLCSSKAVKHTEKRILVLSVLERKKGRKEGVWTYRHIPETEAEELHRLYHMYEFSDRFRVFPETEACGNLFNFFQTGILGQEEVWEAYLK